MKIREDKWTYIVRAIAYVFVTIFAVLCLIPFLLMISGSFSTETIITVSGFGILPKGFTLDAYSLLFKAPKYLLGSYIVTIVMTVCGTGLGLFLILHDGICAPEKRFCIP